MSFNLKKNLAKENLGDIMMIAAAVLFIAILLIGGYYWQQTSRASALETAICKMVKPEMLNPGVCGKE